MERDPYYTEPTVTAEQARAIQLLLSALLIRWRGDRKWLYLLCQQLAALGGHREGPWPSTVGVLRRLGISAQELDERWDIATGVDRLLPIEVVSAFVPYELWPILWELIEQGPRPAGRRVEGLYRAWTKGRTPAGELRARGRLGEQTIELHISTFWGLMDELGELHMDKSTPGVPALAARRLPEAATAPEARRRSVVRRPAGAGAPDRAEGPPEAQRARPRAQAHKARQADALPAFARAGDGRALPAPRRP